MINDIQFYPIPPVLLVQQTTRQYNPYQQTVIKDKDFEKYLKKIKPKHKERKQYHEYDLVRDA